MLPTFSIESIAAFLESTFFFSLENKKGTLYAAYILYGAC
jgi:hypothetical protein